MLNSNRRRQYYATKIRALTFFDLDRALSQDFPPRPSATELLPLPNLRKLYLNVTVGHEVDREWLLSLVAAVASQLTNFHMYGGAAWLMDILHLLRDANAPLQELSLVVLKRSARLDEWRFLRFLETYPSNPARPLACLTLTGEASTALLSRPVLAHLANRTGLRRLELQRRLAIGSIRHLLSAQIPPAAKRAPFADLVHLSLDITSRAMCLLAPSLGRLRHLTLRIADGPPPSTIAVLAAVAASLPCLRSLDICYHFKEFEQPEDLLALQSMAELRQLVLAPPKEEALGWVRLYKRPAVPLRPVSDTDFAQLFQAIGARLRELVLWASLPWHSIDALRAIGRACPVLETLVLAGRHDLRKLGTMDRPLYRPLRKLHLGGGVVADVEASENLRLVRQEHFCVLT
jgi:hypothetical protein